MLRFGCVIVPFLPTELRLLLLIKVDIYTVPVDGGRAMQLTTNPAHDTEPVWSPDGKRIAFASDRMGSMDVYIVPKREASRAD